MLWNNAGKYRKASRRKRSRADCDAEAERAENGAEPLNAVGPARPALEQTDSFTITRPAFEPPNSLSVTRRCNPFGKHGSPDSREQPALVDHVPDLEAAGNISAVSTFIV